MLTHAINFAENYQSKLDDNSLLSPGGVTHPSLFVFFGEEHASGGEGESDGADGGAFAKIESAASRMRSAFFLRLGQGEAEDEIRSVKAAIQRNDAGLNLKRVNVSVIVPAYTESAAGFAEMGRGIRKIFEEDVAVVHMTLTLLLSESNAATDYKARAANCYAALTRAEGFQRETFGRVFDRVFVFSDRNEADTVSGVNAENNAALVAHLPRLLSTGSLFDQNLAKKSVDAGTFYFSTAGMARLEKPSFDIAFTVFKRVAERGLARLKTFAEGGAGVRADTYVKKVVGTDGSIIPQMQSLAAKNVPARKLRGKTLLEAESLIYGAAAERFFEANYNFEHVEEAEKAQGIISAAQLNACAEMLGSQTAQADALQVKLDKAYAAVCKPGLFGGLDAVKRNIEEAYVIKYKLKECRAVQAAVQNLYNAYAQNFERLKIFLKELESSVLELNQRPDPGGHLYAYYGKAADEVFDKHGENFMSGLTEGEAELSLNGFCKAVEVFINQYVWTDDAFNLSFDEDLRKRSQAVAAGEGETLGVEEFYRQTLAALDKRSALAVSLIRYDSLYREKFYLGAAESPLMAYAKEAKMGESVYCAEEPNGFTVIRLAGGFTAEDLTRHRVMKESYEGRKV